MLPRPAPSTGLQERGPTSHTTLPTDFPRENGHIEERRGARRAGTTLLEEARRLYARGDLFAARRLLEHNRDPLDAGAALLYAELLVRAGAAGDARLELERWLPERDPKTVVRAHLVFASASLSCGDVDAAEAALAVVHAHKLVAHESEEAALYAAEAARRRGDVRRMREHLKIASGSADPVLNARAHRFSGNVLVGEARFKEAFAEFGRGFSALHTARPIDDRLLAALLTEVCFAQAEFASTESIAAVAAVEGRDWHACVEPIVAVALGYLGLHHSRHGRHAEATAAFVRSALMAGERPAAVTALVRAHQNARDAGEAAGAGGFYGTALGLASRLDWERTTPADAEALVPLALALARSGDGDLARAYLALFERRYAPASAVSPRAPYLALLAEHAAALVEATGPGDRDAGIRRLRTVRQELSRLGFTWRAMDVRADLFAVTGRTFLLETNRAERRELLRASDAVPGDSEPGGRLSPQQARIVALVARGLATSEIGLELGISARTVKNQLHKIYQKLAIERPSRERLAAYVHANPKLGLGSGTF
jgi:DNA-binding CsgD family transcriptional regulator/tetratricopeptide (TPR) repeat protein